MSELNSLFIRDEILNTLESFDLNLPITIFARTESVDIYSSEYDTTNSCSPYIEIQLNYNDLNHNCYVLINQTKTKENKLCFYVNTVNDAIALVTAVLSTQAF